MITSESTAQLNAAMALAQGAMKPAVKDAENPHFRSRYADLASILDACRAALSANGIAIFQPLSTPGGGLLAVTTRLGHKSGEFLEETVQFPVGQNTAQAYGSAATYARRYALSSMLCIAADDDDGNEASAPSKVEPIRRPPAAAAPKPRPAAALAPASDIATKVFSEARTKFELAAEIVQRNSPISYRSIMDANNLPHDLSFSWEEGKRPTNLAVAYRALKAEADRIVDDTREGA